MLTEFGIYHRLESCVPHFLSREEDGARTKIICLIAKDIQHPKIRNVNGILKMPAEFQSNEYQKGIQ